MADMTPMQQELLKRADSIFASISNATATVVEFGKEQVPDIAYQFITYNRAYLTAVIVILITILVVQQVLSIKLFNKQFSYAKTKYGENSYNCEAAKSDAIFYYVVATVPTALAALIPIATNLKAFFMVWFAPKIYLLMEITKLVKG